MCINHPLIYRGGVTITITTAVSPPRGGVNLDRFTADLNEPAMLDLSIQSVGQRP